MQILINKAFKEDELNKLINSIIDKKITDDIVISFEYLEEKTLNIVQSYFSRLENNEIFIKFNSLTDLIHLRNVYGNFDVIFPFSMFDDEIKIKKAKFYLNRLEMFFIEINIKENLQIEEIKKILINFPAANIKTKLENFTNDHDETRKIKNNILELIYLKKEFNFLIINNFSLGSNFWNPEEYFALAIQTVGKETMGLEDLFIEV